jgi:hypothetical protein
MQEACIVWNSTVTVTESVQPHPTVRLLQQQQSLLHSYTRLHGLPKIAGVKLRNAAVLLPTTLQSQDKRCIGSHVWYMRDTPRQDMTCAKPVGTAHVTYPRLMHSLLMSLDRLVKYSSKVVPAAAPLKQLSILS